MTNLNLKFLSESRTQDSLSKDDNSNGAAIQIEQLYKYYGDVKVLEDLDLVEWPQSTKEMQINWIGK